MKFTPILFLTYLLWSLATLGNAAPNEVKSTAQGFNPFRVLGYERDSSIEKESLQSRYKEKLRRAKTAQDKSKIEFSYFLLSNSETLTQLKEGKSIPELELSVPRRNQKELYNLLQKIDPEKASILEATGKFSLSTIQNMAVFYSVVGAGEYLSCILENDAIGCRSYLQGLKDPVGHLGFLGFVLGAQAGTALSNKITGRPAFSGHAGMVVGALMNELIMEFAHNDHVKNIRKLKEQCTKETSKKNKVENCKKELQDELDKEWKALWEETFKSNDWWYEKGPMLSSLLSAASLSAGTSYAMKLGVDKIIPADASCSKKWAFIKVWNEGQLRHQLSGKKKYLYELSAEAGGIAMFLSWMPLTGWLADYVWDRIPLQINLSSLRNKIKKNESIDIGPYLKDSDKAWDQFRREKMVKAEEIMGLYLNEKNEMKLEKEKAKNFYTWIVNGQREDDETWDFLIKEQYFGKYAEPKEKKVTSAMKSYIWGMFCGPEVRDAVNFPTAVGSIQLPVRLSVSVTPYRIFDSLDDKCKVHPNLREKVIEGFRKKLAQLPREELEQKIASRDKIVTAKIEDYQGKQNNTYEIRVWPKLKKVLEGPANESEGKGLLGDTSELSSPEDWAMKQGKKQFLPQTVLEAFNEQEKDYLKLKERSVEQKDIDLIDESLRQLGKKREAAKNLADYFKQDPTKREKPDMDPEVFFDSLTQDEQEEWVKAVNFFNGFLLRGE